MSVALVHDYLTQRGGAERVVVALTRAFPGAPVHTSLYEPSGTFPEFAAADVRPGPLDRVPFLRADHRLALPLLAPAFSRLRVEADVVVCSSSGWAHGARVDGRKVVYCHTPARWLYQGDRYLGERGSGAARSALRVLARPLRAWDRAAARSADRYLANSSVVRDRIRDAYGIEAEVVPPPPALGPDGPRRAVAGLDAGFVLCVSRLLPYKNVGAVVEAFAGLPGERLVIAGRGPDEAALRRSAPANVTVLGSVDDDELRWLYGSCRAVVAASFEDFGLTPLEGAGFGKPAAVLRYGGFLDTVVDGRTGVFFEAPEPAAIRAAVARLASDTAGAAEIHAHAGRFGEARFAARLREIVAEEAAA